MVWVGAKGGADAVGGSNQRYEFERAGLEVHGAVGRGAAGQPGIQFDRHDDAGLSVVEESGLRREAVQQSAQTGPSLVSPVPCRPVRTTLQRKSRISRWCDSSNTGIASPPLKIGNVTRGRLRSETGRG